MSTKTSTKTQYWLLKSEPDCFSIDDLKRNKVEPWDGIRNYQVRNMIRDDMRVGDQCFFYHSRAKEIGVVGQMEIASKAYPDPTQFDPKSDHPDPKSRKDDPTWLLVDVKFVQKFLRIITLNELKIDPKLEGMAVTKKGSRLSITPVSKKHFDYVLKLAQK
ncbi:MAG: putative RNA-binding protein with PUA-like domain [Patiriisocius sp.]|jgi:predicted RNA-binding protein with PUA-like domain